MRFLKYTEEQLRDTIKNSKTLPEVMRKLNITPAGGNYKTINNAISKLNIDISHFEKTYVVPIYKGKIPLEQLLVDGKKCDNVSLKIKLIKAGLKKDQCENCKIVDWMNKPLNFELHHIDGNPKNNKLENLQILCPICHSQTKNYKKRKRNND